MRFNTGRNLALGTLIGIWAVTAAMVIGWVINIFKIVGALDGPINAWLIGRCVGVFVAPLGGVLGWL